MLLAPHRHSLAAGLLRLAAAWLAVILVLQGLAAAQWLGSGPLHRHRTTTASAAAAVLAHAHVHAHGLAERHHHDLHDASIVPAGDPEGLDPVAFALTAALALMALGAAWPRRAAGRGVWRPTAGWPPASAWQTLPLRPPRRR